MVGQVGCRRTCRRSARSTPVTYTHDAGNLSVVYRLNGVVDRSADHGVLPHLLVVAALNRAKPLSCILPGTDLVFSEKETPEVDVFGIWDEQVLAGEVKTSSSEFTPEQLQRDVQLSKRLGADIHLLAAIDTVDPSTAKQAQALCTQAGLELLVYDKARLRPPNPEADPADTATETFQRLQSALALLLQDLERDPARAAAKSGLILKTAMAPRSPSAGQVDALKSVIDRLGAGLIAPLRVVQQTVADLTDAEWKPDPT
jgi:hypothetical protein